MLEIWGKDYCLVSSLSWKLNSEVPTVESHEREIEVLGNQVLGSKGIKPIDGISESTGISDVFPGKRGQTRCDTLMLATFSFECAQ